MNDREAGAAPALRAAAGVVLSLAAAGFWGWVAESLFVAGLTLVCGLVPAMLERRRPVGSLAVACLTPFGIGAMWTAAERVLTRLGAGAVGRLGGP